MLRLILFVGWICAISALIAMAIGHSGEHDLHWTANQISSYAAGAPHGNWITASMLLSVMTLFILSLLFSRFKVFGEHVLISMVPLVAGSAIGGLLVLARYQETARTVTLLKSAGYATIRQQSFHDTGLLIFYFSSIALTMSLGLIAITTQRHWLRKAVGLVIFSAGPISLVLMRTAWPGLVGAVGNNTGLKQRAALLCLWFAFVLVLALASMQVRATGRATEVR